MIALDADVIRAICHQPYIQAYLNRAIVVTFYNSENDLYIIGFCFGIKLKTPFFGVLSREPMLEFWHLFIQLATP